MRTRAFREVVRANGTRHQYWRYGKRWHKIRIPSEGEIKQAVLKVEQISSFHELIEAGYPIQRAA